MTWTLGFWVLALLRIGLAQAAGELSSTPVQRPLVHFLELDDSCPAEWIEETCSGLGIRVKTVPVGGSSVELSALPEKIGQETVQGIFVVMPKGTEGVDLGIHFIEGKTTESVSLQAKTCDDAVTMAVLLINRRLKSLSRTKSPLPTVDLTQFYRPAPADVPTDVYETAPTVVEPGPGKPVERPIASVGALAWFGRDLDPMAPGILGGEMRAGLRPLVWFELSLSLGGGWLVTTPVKDPKAEGFVLSAAMRAGAVIYLDVVDLSATLGLDVSNYFIRIEDSRYRYQHGWLPRVEAALCAQFEFPVDFVIEGVFGWSLWNIVVLAGDHGRIMEIGGLRFLVRIGFSFDFY